MPETSSRHDVLAHSSLLLTFTANPLKLDGPILGSKDAEPSYVCGKPWDLWLRTLG